MQFLVIARDGEDLEAPARRAAVRPTHLASIRPFVEEGRILIGGAILDQSQAMVGSMLLADFDSRRELDDWLERDPYVTEGVWQRIEVHPFRTAVGTWMSSG